MFNLKAGSAKRFSSENRPTPQDDLQAPRAMLESPPSPMHYKGLKSGPEFTLEHEPNQALPIDGSNSLLRVLSPFMIRVEPPMVYSAAGGNAKKKDFAKVLEAGRGNAPSAYQASRNAISSTLEDSPISNMGASAQEYVSQGIMHRSRGPDGTQVMDLKGRGPTKIGQPSIADLYTAVDITMQLRALLETPPLVLLINPTTLSMKYAKKQQFTDRTRYGFVFQAWGEEQPRLSIEAKCGAFISGSRGVQWASKRDSAAWQNLMMAFQFYRHNGYIYDTVGKSNAHHFVGALSIHYDQWVYYGNMESFAYNIEEVNQHGGIGFTMEFVVNAMVDTSKANLAVTPMRSPVPSPSDPRYSGWGNRATPGTGSHDLVIGGAGQPVQSGPADYASVLGKVPKVSQGLVTALPSNLGFQGVVLVPTPAPVGSSAKKPAPFRAR